MENSSDSNRTQYCRITVGYSRMRTSHSAKVIVECELVRAGATGFLCRANAARKTGAAYQRSIVREKGPSGAAEIRSVSRIMTGNWGRTPGKHSRGQATLPP